MWGSRRNTLLSLLVIGSAVLLLLVTPQMGLLTAAPLRPTTLASTIWRQALNMLRGPIRVGIQVGHWRVEDYPEELEALRYNTGARANGVDEVKLNLTVAKALKRKLEAYGMVVDLLPATVPLRYRADLVVAIHADSSPDRRRRGYKSAHYRTPRNRLEPLLKERLDSAFLAASGLPDDDENVTGAMLEYYAFNTRHYLHSVSRGTPAVIVELGYISNLEDLAFLEDPERPAAALAKGITAYLEDHGRLHLAAGQRP